MPTAKSKWVYGALHRAVIQVYRREESYGVRDISMDTLDDLIEWQLHFDKTHDHMSKPVQWYVLR